MNLYNSLFGISLLNIVLWLALGLVVGFIVHAIDPRDVRGGVWGAMLLGILGAIVGGVASALIFGIGFIGFSLPGLLTAIAGALMLAFLSRLFFERTESATPQQPVGSQQYAYVGAKGGKASTKTQKNVFHHTVNDGHEIVNPVQVEKFLRHVDYPADKEELLTAAQAEGADENVLHTLAEIPGDTFEGPTGVSKAIGKIK